MSGRSGGSEATPTAEEGGRRWVPAESQFDSHVQKLQRAVQEDPLNYYSFGSKNLMVLNALEMMATRVLEDPLALCTFLACASTLQETFGPSAALTESTT
jgi:hypothetical protein